MIALSTLCASAGEVAVWMTPIYASISVRPCADVRRPSCPLNWARYLSLATCAWAGGIDCKGDRLPTAPDATGPITAQSLPSPGAAPATDVTVPVSAVAAVSTTSAAMLCTFIIISIEDIGISTRSEKRYHHPFGYRNSLWFSVFRRRDCRDTPAPPAPGGSADRPR